MTYPAAIIIVAIIVTSILLVKVVPSLNPCFKGSELTCRHSPKW